MLRSIEGGRAKRTLFFFTSPFALIPRTWVPEVSAGIGNNPV